MNKLDAIRKIVEAQDVKVTSQLAGIRRILDEDEDLAETIAGVFSQTTEQLRNKALGK